MRTKLLFLTALTVLSPLVFAGQTTSPTQAPWVDPNQVRGRLLISVDVYAGTGMTAFGTVSDPEGQKLTAAWNAPNGSACSYDANTGIWEVTWWPAAADVGIHYVVMTFTEELANQPQPLADTATVAVRVLPENKPPVIVFGGCRILRR